MTKLFSVPSGNKAVSRTICLVLPGNRDGERPEGEREDDEREERYQKACAAQRLLFAGLRVAYA